MKYYLYRTENLVNGNYHVGVHGSENPESDDYFGSGTLINKAVKKYGRDKFRTVILEYFSSWKEALKREKEVVNCDMLRDPKSYNLIEGGTGVCRKPKPLQSPEGTIVRVSQIKVEQLKSEGYTEVHRVRLHRGSEEIVRASNLIQPYLDQGWSPGPSEDHRNKIRARATGRKHTEESRNKISKALRGRKCSDEHRKHNSEAKRGVPNYKLRGRQVSESTREKLSRSIKEYYTRHPEQKQRLKGRIYINDGIVVKRVYPEELEGYLKSGWIKGNVRFCFIQNKVTGERKKVKESDRFVYLDKGWSLVNSKRF